MLEPACAADPQGKQDFQHPRFKLNQTIALIGLMGAGKTAVGRTIAERIGVPFIDADAEIERAAGMSISDIFAKHGEASFRDGERRVIARLMESPPFVLATGGGAYMDSQTRDLLQQKSTTFWLRAQLDVLVKRCAKRDHRPLLKGKDPAVVLGALIKQRYPVYAQSDLVFDSQDVPLEQSLAGVIQALIAAKTIEHLA